MNSKLLGERAFVLLQEMTDSECFSCTPTGLSWCLEFHYFLPAIADSLGTEFSWEWGNLWPISDTGLVGRAVPHHPLQSTAPTLTVPEHRNTTANT